MRKTAMAMLVVLTLVGYTAVSTADHPTEREASFVGSTLVEHDLNEACADTIGEEECVTRIIQGIISIVCDGGDGHPYTAGLYDGIGGTSFCNIPIGTTVTLQYADTVGTFGANGIVTCPETDPDDPDAVTWNTEIGRLSGEASQAIEVPDFCDEVGDDEHPGVSNVNVFNVAASLTNEELGIILEGTVTLAY